MIHKGRKIRKRRAKKTSKFFYIILGAVLLGAVWFLVDANWKINKKRSEFSAQINKMEKELQELERLQAEYELGLERVQTNEFWEEKLREEHGYRKPGEGVFVVVPQEEVQQDLIEPEKSFWQRLLERLGF